MTPRLTTLAATGALVASSVTARAQQTAPAQPPSLVVFIAVDQMRADYLERFGAQFTGGLKRLYGGGAVMTQAFHDHAITETAPGHSVMLSGRFPRGTGIVTNTLGVPDSTAPMVGGGGPGASPRRFRGTVLMDWMTAKDDRSHGLSVSRKDRGAILPMGRAKQSVFWYATDGRFTTSTYYGSSLPEWVDQFNAKQIGRKYAGHVWNLLLPASEYREVDDVQYENLGRGNTTFPHPMPGDSAQAARLLTEFPEMDSVIAQFALAGVTAMKLGAGPQTDLLSVSFSTTDAVGHRYGPESREIHDQILRLDRTLGTFIDSLYKLRDSARIVFALTADHGVGPLPEIRAEREHKPIERPDVIPVLNQIDLDLKARGDNAGALIYEDDIILLNRRQLSRIKVNADSLLGVVARAVRAIPGIQRVDTVRTLAGKDTTTDYVARRWLHMLPADLPADLVVTMNPYAYVASVEMSTHGTPHDYDAQVPVIFYGPPFVPGKYPSRALVADIAPTLASVIGVTPTEKLDGRVRVDILKR